MAIAKVVEIQAGSPSSFEDAIAGETIWLTTAIEQGLAKAGESVRNIKGAWVKDQQVVVDGGKVTEYRVDLKVTFVLD